MEEFAATVQGNKRSMLMTSQTSKGKRASIDSVQVRGDVSHDLRRSQYLKKRQQLGSSMQFNAETIKDNRAAANEKEFEDESERVMNWIRDDKPDDYASECKKDKGKVTGRAQFVFKPTSGYARANLG
jgi:hypothetical protein